MTLRLSLKKLIETCPDKGRALMTVVNRARNKPSLLSLLKSQLTSGKLGLLEASRLFLRLTGVYK